MRLVSSLCHASIALAFAVVALPAGSEPMQFSGVMTFQIGNVTPISITGTGNADVSGLPASPRVALPAGAFAGELVVSVTDPQAFPIAGVAVEASHQAGTFERPLPGAPIGGVMPLAGLARACLFAVCDASPTVNIEIPLDVVGRDATAFVTGPVNLTVMGAPWTTGELPDPPFSWVEGDVEAGADHVSLSLVTPVFISSNLGAYPEIPSFARLTLAAGGDCDNGQDDDGDGAVDFPDDAGCSSATDPSEQPAIEACRNGSDDDGDGLADFPADPGCSALRDTSERSSLLVCDNGLDDDADGFVDLLDNGCTSLTDADETGTGPSVCQNGIDDDNDRMTDYPLDPGCASLEDEDERGDLACDDALDADGDSRVAYPGDPGCIGPSDPDERRLSLACDDGLDNDGNGLVDFPADPGCTSLVNDTLEGAHLPACSNGFDDDGDGAVDLADGACDGPADNAEEIVFTGFGDVIVTAANSLHDESALATGGSVVRLLDDGVIGHQFRLTPGGGLVFDGGTIAGDLLTPISLTMDSGAVLGTLRVGGFPVVFVTGGSLGAIEAADSSRVRLRVTDTGGRALGPVVETTGTLDVVLTDGTAVSIPFLRDPRATIELVPEPASAAGALAAIVALRALARRHRR